MPLTAKQEHFARLIALGGLSQHDAYLQAYNVRPGTDPATINDNGYTLAHHTDIAPRIAELKASLVDEAVTDAASLVKELLTVGNVQVPASHVRAADKVAALDKVAKILGLYKDTEDARSSRPPVITNITVILSRGAGKEVVDLPGRVVEAASGEPEVGPGMEEGLEAPE